MADAQNRLSPPSAADAAPPSQDRNPQTSHQKRHTRHRKTPSKSLLTTDGSVSDSVVNPLASAQSNKGPKRRQQSVALGGLPHQNGNMAAGPHEQNQRPASHGSNMPSATPLKEAAYAGPTFSASPAPSSLPVPKFFSRSVPNVAQRPLDARMAGEKTPDTYDSSPEPDIVSPQPVARSSAQSPLDIFFNADRAEKGSNPNSSMLSPDVARRQAHPATEPRIRAPQNGGNVFLRELDGHHKDRISPKPVSYNDRRPQTHLRDTLSDNSAPASDGDSESEATRTLKDLLFNGIGSSAQTITPPYVQQSAQPNPNAPDTAFHTPSPFQRSSSGPPTPAPSADQQYSLHYGNRNLSPLFKAARADTPSRPSGLRQQELASDTSPLTNSAIGVQTQHRQTPQIDPNSFSRDFLDRTIQASHPAAPPKQPVTGHGGNTTPQSNPVSSQHQHGLQASGADVGSASPRTAGGSGTPSRDTRGMEDDLRRMLNLNVLSN